jgi:hypothetical protein
LILALLLFWPSLRRVAIPRCPGNSIEVGRTPSNEPMCLPRQHSRRYRASRTDADADETLNLG